MCGKGVYDSYGGEKKPEVKPMGNEEMIARVYYANNPKSQRVFADALGVSQPYIAKCLKKYSELSGYQYQTVKMLIISKIKEHER